MLDNDKLSCPAKNYVFSSSLGCEKSAYPDLLRVIYVQRATNLSFLPKRGNPFSSNGVPVVVGVSQLTRKIPSVADSSAVIHLGILPGQTKDEDGCATNFSIAGEEDRHFLMSCSPIGSLTLVRQVQHANAAGVRGVPAKKWVVGGLGDAPSMDCTDVFRLAFK